MGNTSPSARVQDKKRRKSTTKKEASPQPIQPLPAVADSKELNAVILLELLRAAFVQLWRNHEHINKINVFPVPDGDTGTNMMMTFRAGLEKVLSLPPTKMMPLLLSKFTASALMAAQGNSGTITTAFFSELTKSLSTKKDLHTCTFNEFADYLGPVGKAMMGSMTTPKRGTLLSVIEVSIEQLVKHAEATPDLTLSDFVKTWQKLAQIELEKTPDQLEVDGKFVLKERNVVDSGAQGFLYLLDGMALAIDGKLDYGNYLEKIKHESVDDHFEEEKLGGDADDISGMKEEDIKHQYCTEFVVELAEGKTKKMLTDAIQGFGDSLVCVVADLGHGKQLAKVHIHSNVPDEVFAVARTFTEDGMLLKEKTDDMKEQVRELATDRPDMSKAKVRICISSGVIVPNYLKPMFAQYTVMNRLSLDGEAFRDQADIDSKYFYNNLRMDTYKTVQTAAAPVRDYVTIIERGLDDKDEVVYLSLNGKVSAGSVNALDAALKELSEEKRERVAVLYGVFPGVIDGLTAIKCVELAATGMGAHEIVQTIERDYFDNYAVSVSMYTSKNLIRGGRIKVGPLGPLITASGVMFATMGVSSGGAQDCLSKAMGVEFGNSSKDKTTRCIMPSIKGATWSYKSCVDTSVEAVVKFFKGKGPVDVFIGHTCVAQCTLDAYNYVKRELDIANLYVGEMNPTGGAHFGARSVFIGACLANPPGK